MLKSLFLRLYSYLPVKCLLLINKVKFGGGKINGGFYIRVHKSGLCEIKKGFASNSNYFAIDNSVCTKIIVYSTGKLLIGENVGMTSTCITCQHKITIGNYTKIGAGCLITDTDHHSLDFNIRRTGNDLEFAKSKEISIGEDVFIGARSLILKGITIGNRSVIAAGSVVTTNIPEDELWGGNPAKLIKKINI